MRPSLWLLAIALPLLSGCVSDKYVSYGGSVSPPTPFAAELGGDPVSARLDFAIIYHGPGMWKKEAFWDEFQFTFTNRSDRPVTLATVLVVDRQGNQLPPGADPWVLERASSDLRRRYENAGVNFALNTLGYAALTYGAVGAGMITGAAITSTWGGLAAGAVVGAAVVPVTAIVVVAKNSKQRRIVEAEFQRRRLPLPLELAPGASRTGSLFFPMSVSPRELIVHWSRDGAAGTTTLPTPQLRGLHEAEASAKRR